MPEKKTDKDNIMNAVKTKAKDIYDYGKEKVIAAKDKTENKIREHPLESVLIAAGIGALIGAGVALWINSMMRRRE
ncbi:MAG: DUF883 C-terminal domain-containing protein [Candidatus Pacearchaeota archaeon]